MPIPTLLAGTSRLRSVGLGKAPAGGGCTIEPMRSTAAVSKPRSLEGPSELALRRFANLVARYAPHEGAFPLRLPGTFVVRRSHITSEPMYATMRPAVCIVAQGAKVVMVGRDVV